MKLRTKLTPDMILHSDENIKKNCMKDKGFTIVN